MDEDYEKQKKSSTTLVVVILVILPVLYVLSAGPAIEFVYSNPTRGSSEIINRFYGPLKWLLREAPWLQKPMSNYINYWQKL